MKFESIGGYNLSGHGGADSARDVCASDANGACDGSAAAARRSLGVRAAANSYPCTLPQCFPKRHVVA